MRKLLLLACILYFVAGQAPAQGNKETATKLLREAIRLMDDGSIDESMALLDSAHKMDPDNYVYDYEKGFAMQLKKDYKAAIRYFEASTRYKNTTDQCFQMVGNNYDHDGDAKKAMEAYNEGLKKFPNSGRLYVEIGVMAFNQEDYNTAVKSWEKGISVHPEYASNYYQLAKMYSLSTDRVWSIFYGEMFMNMERSSARTQEISKILFDAYKGSITISSDSSSKVDFARPMVIDAGSFDPSKKFKFPFDQVFGLDFIFGMLPMTLSKKKEVDIAYLYTARSGFLDRWYDQKRDKEYNNIVIDYQKKIKDNGHFEAYTYWLLMSGNPSEVKDWYATNEEKMTAFIEWSNKNKLEVSKNNYFLRTEVDK